MTTPPFDSQAPLLVLAPHLRYPARNGSDISLDRMARCMSIYVPQVDLLAEDCIVNFRDGVEISRTPYGNRMRAKQTAAVRTLLRQSHFYLEKFVTAAFRNRARDLIRARRYGSVLFSYVTTTSATEGLVETPPARLVWTHNDEFKWFRDLAGSASNVLGRIVAHTSEGWLHRFFRRDAADYLLLHVTEADQSGYAALYPAHRSLVVPIGVDLPDRHARPLLPGTPSVRLTFVGSLGVRMNLDALQHFAEHFDERIRAEAGVPVDVCVAGSSPTDEIRLLCEARRWTLRADLSDDDLDALIELSTFTILPFGYATGAKLKLLKSMAHGVPFLATASVSAQEDACVYPSLISDDPEEWVGRIHAVLEGGIGPNEREALVSVARRHSWEASAKALYDHVARTATEGGS